MTRLAVSVAIFLTFTSLFVWRNQRQGMEAPTTFLGYVEGETLYIGPTESERLARLDVAIGDRVTAGAPLFRMSTELLDRDRAEAAARLHQFEAQLQNLRAAMSRPQQIAVLQAGLERAEAALTLTKTNYERQRILFSQKHIARAALDRAAMELARDVASVKEARRQVEVAGLSSRSQEITAAEAAVTQSRAALDAIDFRIARQSVAAPTAGDVQDIFFRIGEVVVTGQPVIALLPPQNRKLRFYVQEPQLPTLRLGERVAISCDGCSGDLYGRISFISGKQEYTPPVIYSDAERAKLVFKVEARLEGPASELPLGLPIRARLAPEISGAVR